LICVFGCGGDRDKTKRPLMAMIAERLADQVIITNDNPRHEDPQAIIADIRQGLSKPEAVWIDMDRAQAIQKAIKGAAPQDCVLIAGKGAEHYQQIGDAKFPFDDLTIAKETLNSCHGQ
jgi:UDP-N-acetylmuramoyl-L-alanyl-D-glutamate--2,6-diaminopimelate ligase